MVHSASKRIKAALLPRWMYRRQFANMASFAGVLFAAVFSFSAFGDCVLLDDFYPFGESAEDDEMTLGDNLSSDPLQLGVPFPYYGREESILHVSRSCLLLIILSCMHASTSKDYIRVGFDCIYAVVDFPRNSR